MKLLPDNDSTPSGSATRAHSGSGDQRLSKTVSDLMRTPPIVISTSGSLVDAATRMRENEVGSVIVVAPEATETLDPIDKVAPSIAGIITERDLVRATSSGVNPATEAVSDWMTLDPHTVDQESEVIEAWRDLASHSYRHIPVVDAAGGLTGVVSMRDLFRVSALRPVEGQFADVPKGMEGVVAAETHTGTVNGELGFYQYRQYDAVELSRTRSFEEVAALMIDAELPSRDALSRFVADLNTARASVGEIKAASEETLRLGLHPDYSLSEDGVTPTSKLSEANQMARLRTAASKLGEAFLMKPTFDSSPVQRRRDCIRMISSLPAIAASNWRMSQGLDPVEPRDDLGFVANYAWMLIGSELPPAQAQALEKYMISTMDHGLNASTFTVRVVTSTGADLGAIVSAGIGALSGPLHGGAPSRVLEMLREIGDPDNAYRYIKKKIEDGERIMGFGHRIYKTLDPRSELMKEVALELGGSLVELAVEVESTVVQLLDELKPGRDLYTNVEFYSSVVMNLCGIPNPMLTPTFALSRCVGWSAHSLEQASDNRIIRPASRYIGPAALQPL